MSSLLTDKDKIKTLFLISHKGVKFAPSRLQYTRRIKHTSASFNGHSWLNTRRVLSIFSSSKYPKMQTQTAAARLLLLGWLQQWNARQVILCHWGIARLTADVKRYFLARNHGFRLQIRPSNQQENYLLHFGQGLCALLAIRRPQCICNISLTCQWCSFSTRTEKSRSDEVLWLELLLKWPLFPALRRDTHAALARDVKISRVQWRVFSMFSVSVCIVYACCVPRLVVTMRGPLCWLQVHGDGMSVQVKKYLHCTILRKYMHKK